MKISECISNLRNDKALRFSFYIARYQIAFFCLGIVFVLSGFQPLWLSGWVLIIFNGIAGIYFFQKTYRCTKPVELLIDKFLAMQKKGD